MKGQGYVHFLGLNVEEATDKDDKLQLALGVRGKDDLRLGVGSGRGRADGLDPAGGNNGVSVGLLG